MQFSQSSYFQSENITPLSVSLVLESFAGSVGLTQDIVEEITAFAQEIDTATGKKG